MAVPPAIAMFLSFRNYPVHLCSYHLNGFESPLIRVVRGIEYTFNVMVRSSLVS